MDQRLFGADNELATKTITTGDLSDQTKTLTVSGDADYVIVVVTDDSGATDSSTEST
jgi:hypothetical protein